MVCNSSSLLVAAVVGSCWGPDMVYSGNRVMVGARYEACCCSMPITADTANRTAVSCWGLGPVAKDGCGCSGESCTAG